MIPPEKLKPEFSMDDKVRAWVRVSPTGDPGRVRIVGWDEDEKMALTEDVYENLLVSASRDKSWRIRDVLTGYCVETIRGHADCECTCNCNITLIKSSPTPAARVNSQANRVEIMHRMLIKVLQPTKLCNPVNSCKKS
jgi:hypothetical protein